MLKLAALGLSVAWKTGLIISASVLAGGAAVQTAHLVAGRRARKAGEAPAPAKA